jgi:hypothetical protein
MLTHTKRGEVKKKLATAKQWFLKNTILTIAQAARDSNISKMRKTCHMHIIGKS